MPQPIGRMGAGREGVESFRLGYVDATPERAQRIANRLATVFVEENSKTKTQQAQNTSEVLAQQLKASQERLAQAAGTAAGEEAGEHRPAARSDERQRLDGQRPAPAARIAVAAAAHRAGPAVDARGAARADEAGRRRRHDVDRRGGDSGRRRRAINDLERQLRQYQANGYTDQHPDIIATKEELAVARRELTSTRQAEPGATAPTCVATDPAYRQKINERDAARLRIATLQRQLGQALGQIGSYQARVDSAPLVEQELSSLRAGTNRSNGSATRT